MGVASDNGGNSADFSDNTSMFKLGSTVLVKLTLSNASACITRCGGQALRGQGHRPGGTKAETSSTATASSGNLFRYDASSEHYIFNLSTKGLTAGTYQLRFHLADARGRTVGVSLR